MGQHSKFFHLIFLLTGLIMGRFSSELYNDNTNEIKIHYSTETIYPPILNNRSSAPSTQTLTHHPPPKPIPNLLTRNEIPFILEREKMEIGIELGVQRGEFSLHTLKNWPSCKEYHLVDVWKQQKNYKDYANENNTKQEEIFQTAKRNLKPWLKSEKGGGNNNNNNKVRICRNFTSICAKQYPNMYFDYIYIDARHDYKGVLDDIINWWPKLKKGGIISGHDYATYDKTQKTSLNTIQNWRLNYDGTIDKTGRIVRGAVDDFFMPSAALSSMPLSAESLLTNNNKAPKAHVNILSFDGEYERQVVVGYNDGRFPSWMVRK